MLVESLRRATRQLGPERGLRALSADCELLLSQRGEASSTQIARQIVERLSDLLDEPGPKQGAPASPLDRFFTHLANDFSPEPAAVLASAQAYAEQPDAAHLIAELYIHALQAAVDLGYGLYGRGANQIADDEDAFRQRRALGGRELHWHGRTPRAAAALTAGAGRDRRARCVSRCVSLAGERHERGER